MNQPESAMEVSGSGDSPEREPIKGLRTIGRKGGLEDRREKWSPTSCWSDLISNLILGRNECLP